MLKRIPSELIRPGFSLPGGLCDKAGRLLIATGTCLTDAHLTAIRRHLILGVYGGSDWPADSSQEDTARDRADEPVERDALRWTNIWTEPGKRATDSDENTMCVEVLRAGMRLSESIYDEAGLLLLAAGTVITSRCLDLLSQRSIKRVRLRSVEPHPKSDRAESESASRLDDLLTRELAKTPPLCPRIASKRPQLPLSDLRAEARRGLQKHATTSGLMAETCQALEGTRSVSVEEVREAVRDFADMATLDADLLPLILSMQNAAGEYLFDHCVNVALISIAMAAQLGVRHDQLLEVGLGALLQDTGMLRVPDEIRLAPRPLTDDEWIEIQRHPYYTIEYLEKIRGLPATVGFVGYQLHERTDASGYPRRLSGMFVHPYAKIAGVADAYVAMIRTRPHRPPMPPYLAAKTVLVERSVNKFDRTMVRAFLDSVSLFPIGSLVELSDGSRTTVVRATPGLHTRPVVEVVDCDQKPAGQIIDLSKETNLSVTRALSQTPYEGSAPVANA